jgi:hypothetical protein
MLSSPTLLLINPLLKLPDALNPTTLLARSTNFSFV